MNTNAVQQIQDAVAKAQSIGIAVGQNPTVDTMGASLALYLFLKDLGKKVSIASPSDPIVELTNLVGIDHVKRQLETDGGDLVVAFPYTEGEIEKVSYTLENGFLNIVVKAGEKGLSFTEQDVDFKRGNGNLDILFVIGTPRLTDLGDVFNPEAFKETTIINIDSKEHNQRFGEIVLVEPAAASVSEVVAPVITEMSGEYGVDIAQNLLNGISFATENFQSPRTSVTSFELAAALMRRGAIRRASAPQRVQEQRPQQQSQQNDRRDRRPQFNPMRQQAQSVQQPIRQQQPAQRQEQVTPIQQPQQEVSQPEPLSAPASQAADALQRPPSDWLTPKVYKGSTSV